MILQKKPGIMPRKPKIKLEIERRVLEENNNLCWNFPGRPNAYGYGWFKFNGIMISAHRYAYELRFGNDGFTDLEFNHLCRNRDCYNPSHLEKITHKENVEYAYAKYDGCMKNHGIEYIYYNKSDRHKRCRKCRSLRGS
jgi:hypothetical protein